MLLGRILAAIAVIGALAMTAIGVWRGDTWGIGIGVLTVLGTASSAIVIWRARRQESR